MSRLRCVVVVVVAVFVGLVGAVGCSDTSVPDGAFISCANEEECPEPLVCDPASLLCVREQPDPLVPTATLSRALVGGPDIAGGVAVDVALAFASPPLRAPRVDVERDGVVVASVTATEAGDAFAAALVPSAAWHDGVDVDVDVVVEAVNGAGVVERAVVGAIAVDITAPILSDVGVSRVANPQATPFAFEIIDDKPVGKNTAVRISLVPSEAVVLEGEDAAALTLVGLPAGVEIPLVRVATIASPLVFEIAWPADDVAVDAALVVHARVVDLAGNVADVDVKAGADALVVDTIAPAAPAVDVEGAVVFERAPWGRGERAGFDVFTVTGTAAVEADAHVLIARGADGGRELGRTRADAAGNFGGIDGGVDDFVLDTADVVDVYVVAGDAAGNVSAPVRVRESVFFAALAGERADDDAVNPHAFERMAIATDVLNQADVVAEDGDALAAVDAVAVEVEGAGSFEFVSVALGDDDVSSLAGVLVRSAIGFDPSRGITLMVGGRDTRRIEMGGMGLDGRSTCGGAVDDVFVRGRDGRLLRFTGVRPPAMDGAAIAFDPRLDGLVVVGQSAVGAETWLFRDGSFRRLCGEGCGLGPFASSAGHGLAFDPRSARLLAHGGGLGANTFAFDGAAWSKVCGDGVDGCAAPAGAGSLVVDNADRVLWWSGALHAWDGAGWAELCTDATCQAALPRLANSAAAYDRRRDRLVVFGGDRTDLVDNQVTCNFSNVLGVSMGAPLTIVPPNGDTFEFDGTTWARRTLSPAPPPRALHRMAYDELRGQVLVFGGDDCDCLQRNNFGEFDDDLWAYDGLRWERLDRITPPSGFVAEAPFAARDHAMTTWPSQGGVLLFGDSGGGALHLVKNGRFFRGGTASALGAALPGLATADDGTLFAWGGGGLSSGGGGPGAAPGVSRVVDDGSGLITACIDLPEGAGCQFGGPPQGVIGHAFAFDGVRVVGFGGAFEGRGFGFGGKLSDVLASSATHVFDAASGVTDPVTGARPPARFAGVMVKGDVDGTALLYGGAPLDGALWQLEGATWTQVATSTSPPVRWGQVFAREEQRGAAITTLGTDDDLTNDDRGATREREIPAALDDVYEFVDGDWHLANIADPEGDGRPRGRYAVAAATDVDGTVLIHGGTPSPARVFGGPSPSTPRTSELWRYRGGALERPGQRVRVRVRASGFDDVDGATVRWTFADDVDPQTTLSLWRIDHYEPLATTSCGDRCLAADIDAADVRAARYGAEDELIVLMRGAPNGAAPGYTRVRTTFVDVALRRRR